MRTDNPKVLLLTAGYGDGHNSAAAGIAAALEGRADCRVVDLFSAAMPRVFKYSRKGYLWVTGKAPSIWRQIYDWTDSLDMSSEPLAGMSPVTRLLEKTVGEWNPDVIVSTYMVYPHMVDRLFRKTGVKIPSLTVVTDSIAINKTWLCSQTDAWAVTDSATRQVIIDRGTDETRVFTTGFPVNPQLEDLSPEAETSWQSGKPFRILYFPQGGAQQARNMLEALLAAHPDTFVTCVLGRHVRRYYRQLARLKTLHGARLAFKGWTRKVPRLMASHHLVVGKAGGSTTHECIAMSRPMLVNFITPGQEEGNMELLEQIGGGRFTETPEELASVVRLILNNDGRIWKDMQTSLAAFRPRNGARRIANWCLNPTCAELNP